MLLTIDIGNSYILLGGYEGEKLSFKASFSTDTRKSCDEYAMLLKDILSIHGVDKSQIEGGAAASVVPQLTGTICSAFKLVLPDVKLLTVGPGVKTGLNIKIDSPAQMGADMVAAAVGAIAKYPSPMVLIDFGTAIKLCYLDGENSFRGGTIMPGICPSLEALTEKSAQLPCISLLGRVNPISRDTAECMRSGVVLGAAAMVDGMVRRTAKAAGEVKTVIASGAEASLIVPHCEENIITDENLVLEGLKIIYEKNLKK